MKRHTKVEPTEPAEKVVCEFCGEEIYPDDAVECVECGSLGCAECVDKSYNLCDHCDEALDAEENGLDELEYDDA